MFASFRVQLSSVLPVISIFKNGFSSLELSIIVFCYEKVFKTSVAEAYFVQTRLFFICSTSVMESPVHSAMMSGEIFFFKRFSAGTCNYGTADSPYVISCANSDFKQEYIGTHSYTGEDCYNPGSSRTDLYGDYYFVKSAEAMEITLNSATGKKEYLPFIGAIK